MCSARGCATTAWSWAKCDGARPTWTIRCVREHALLATVLQHFLEKAGGEHSKVSNARFDDAAWVGWRLAEFLPLEDAQRLSVLQEDDPHERLDMLLQMMP